MVVGYHRVPPPGVGTPRSVNCRAILLGLRPSRVLIRTMRLARSLPGSIFGGLPKPSALLAGFRQPLLGPLADLAPFLGGHGVANVGGKSLAGVAAVCSVAVHEPPCVALGTLEQTRMVKLASGRPVQRAHQQCVGYAGLNRSYRDLTAIHSRRISAAHNITRHCEQLVATLIAELPQRIMLRSNSIPILTLVLRAHPHITDHPWLRPNEAAARHTPESLRGGVVAELAHPGT